MFDQLCDKKLKGLREVDRILKRDGRKKRIFTSYILRASNFIYIILKMVLL